MLGQHHCRSLELHNPQCLIQRDLHLLNENPKNRAEAPNPELDAVHAQLLQVDKVLPSDQKLIIVE